MSKGIHKHLFSSESVTEGHPDKICDQISDAVLDAIISQDPKCRVACETMVTTGIAIVAGEITTSCYVDIPETARQTIREIGYDNADYGFDYKTCAVFTSIDKQSPDISQGVTEGEGLYNEQGAGDQGIMFGYATNETDNYMPLTIDLAHGLTSRLAEVRKKGILEFLRPDGKSQVSVEYDEGKPVRIDSIVISTQHSPDVHHKELEAAIIEEVIKPTLPAQFVQGDIKYYINPTGRFVVGGPQGDCGLTGRKIIVDTYGGVGAHGGGAFSGKDPSKVDRSASYAARYVAKNIVGAGLAEKCEVQLAYAIGVAQPISVNVCTFNTGKIDEEKLEAIVNDVFDLRPRAIIDKLQLLRPIYRKTAAYGHFGRNDEDFAWEKLDMVDALKSAAGKVGATVA
ncbi:methionine adenosyltransferase [Candidatus Margulisiibacteriota bacterium]